MLAATRRLYMFLGGTFLAGGGLIAAACSTDNGTTTQVPTVGDSGRTDSGGGSSSGSTSSSGSSGETDGGVDCGKLPTVKSSNGPYCFGVADAGEAGAPAGKNCDSSKNEICCSGSAKPGDAGFENSQCVVATESSAAGYEEGACDTEADPAFVYPAQEWHCTEGSQCPGNNEVCCAIGTDAGAPKPGEDNDYPKGCGVYYQSGKYVGGTRCADSCPAGSIQLCSGDSECAAGKCVPLTIAGRYTGYCRL